ncbi:MAG TPA: hypothetical protein VHQ86_05550 [Candidatus Saccharimonadia bacterium]|jgi:hypothetical protein|nr:hypothetical protein [Candidatus Saccharimonadia bacterium]
MTNNLVFSAREPYQNLLNAAVAAQDQGQYKEAVILAQTGVELFTEKILRHLYQAREIEYLKGAFEQLLINYNIGNTKVSGLYIALSGDTIKQEPFWSDFEKHVELRNELVHEGKDATAEEARRSLDVVAMLIQHVVEFNHFG